MKRFVKNMLARFARAIIARQKPLVIGITGSVGKTTTKEAVYAVVSSAMHARKSEKSFNNEIGLPLTVMGAVPPGRSFFGWASVLVKGVWLSLFVSRAYPRALVLEMAADRPGDIAYLCSLAPPDIAIVTAVSLAHAAYLGNLEAIAKEKGILVEKTKKDGWVILNSDDPFVSGMKVKAKTRTALMFGVMAESEVRASEVAIRRIEEGEQETWGVSWKIRSQGSIVPMFMQDVVGRQAVYAGCAAVACGLALGMHLVQIGEALRGMSSPRGRMQVLPGIKRTIIIDDTYNASPFAVRAALETLAEMMPHEGGRRIAILGDMLELGSVAEQEHYDIGLRAVENEIDLLITVGELSRDSERGAVNAGMSQNACLHFPDSESAKRMVQDLLKKNDIVLVKGSQSMRMERIVKEIMAEPARAAELLVRQEKSWLARA